MTTPREAKLVPVELLPCPFCGSSDLTIFEAGPTFHARIKCKPCNLYLPLTAEEWNRRAPLANSREAVIEECALSIVGWIGGDALKIAQGRIRSLKSTTQEKT